MYSTNPLLHMMPGCDAVALACLCSSPMPLLFKSSILGACVKATRSLCSQTECHNQDMYAPQPITAYVHVVSSVSSIINSRVFRSRHSMMARTALPKFYPNSMTPVKEAKASAESSVPTTL